MPWGPKESEARKRYRHNRWRDGLCGWEGCKVVTVDRYYCDEHRERHNARYRNPDASVVRDKDAWPDEAA